MIISMKESASAKEIESVEKLLAEFGFQTVSYTHLGLGGFTAYRTLSNSECRINVSWESDCVR